MTTHSPCRICPLSCEHHDSPSCVRNLIKLPGESAPISLGLRIGLNQVFGKETLPPCVRGPVGSAYWSIQPEAAEAEQEG